LQSKQPTLNEEHVYCSLPRRLMVMLYDAVILIGLLIVASAIALPFGDMEKVALHDFWFTLWLLSACFAYLGGCWRYGGMTLGMRAWRVRLINYGGKKISWPACLLRFIVGMVSLGALGLGILWALIDERSRTWQDLAARTLLIKPPKSH